MKAIGTIAIKEERRFSNEMTSTLTSEETTHFGGDFYGENMVPKYGAQITLPNNIVITANKYAFDQKEHLKSYTATISLQEKIYEVNVEENEQITVNVYASFSHYDDDAPDETYSTEDGTILTVERF